MKPILSLAFALGCLLVTPQMVFAGGGCGPSNSCPGPSLSLNTTYSYGNSSCSSDPDCYDCFVNSNCAAICSGAPNHNEDCNSAVMGAGCFIEGAFCGSPENTSWAQFCPATTGSYTFAVTNISCSGGGASLQFGIYDAGITCANNTQADMQTCAGSLTSNTSYSLSLTAGQCYLIVFDGNAGAACTWNFLITGPPLPATIQNFLVNRSAKDMVIEWATAAEANGKEYQIRRRYDDLTFEEGLTTDQLYNKQVQKVVATIPCQNKANGATYRFVDSYVVDPGLYVYELYLKDLDGSYNFLGMTEAYVDVPTQSRILSTAYHRDNESFDIEVEAKQSALLSLEVYDITGKKVSAITNLRLPAGTHRVPVELRGKTNGIYLYKLKMNGDTFSGKLLKH